MWATAALWALSNATAVGPSALTVFVTHLDASRSLLEAMRLHLPVLIDAHMPAAMLLQHISSIASSNDESPEPSTRVDDDAVNDDLLPPLLDERRNACKLTLCSSLETQVCCCTQTWHFRQKPRPRS